MARCSTKILLPLCLVIAVVHADFDPSQLTGEYALVRGPATCEVDMNITAVQSSNITISGDSINGTNFICQGGALNVVRSSKTSGNTLSAWFGSGLASIGIFLVGTVDPGILCGQRGGGVLNFKKGMKWNFVRPRADVTLDFAIVLQKTVVGTAPLSNENQLVLKADFRYLFVGQECAYEANTTDADITDIEPAPKPSVVPEAVCFPASAQVSLRNGASIRMSQLRAGHHEIAVPTLRGYSPVFLFTHRDLEVSYSNFRRITTATGHAITITNDHYLYANGRLAAARTVRKGDHLELITGKLSPVVSVETHHVERGLIAPHTLHSKDLYVNGIRTSSYTRAVHPTLAHMLLAPIRAVVRLGIAKEPLGNLLYKGASRLERLVPCGPELM